MRNSESARPATRAMVASKTYSCDQPMTQMAKGAATRVVSSRVYFMASLAVPVCRLLSAVRCLFDEYFRIARLDSAVAALARLEVDDRLEEMLFPEVGPEHLRHVDLGVGDLPEEEVRYAQLAAGADQEIGIVDVRGVEVIAEERFVDDRVAHLLLSEDGHDAIDGVDDLRASAVVERDLEQQAGVLRRLLLCVSQLALHGRIEPFDAADRHEADVVLHQRPQLFAQVLLEQHHERGDFVARTLPVLDGERVERHDAELEPRRGLDDLTHRGDAGAVAFHTRKVARFCPASVAVHDDGNVTREPFQVDLFE